MTCPDWSIQAGQLFGRALIVLLVFTGWLSAAGFKVAINEVHYHPADDLRDTEFIEIVNFDTDAVDLGGWSIQGGVNFEFAPGTTLPGQSYILVGYDAASLVERYGLAPEAIVGEYSGSLSNGGERLALHTPKGFLLSWIEYEDDGAWPETADGLGPSLERVAPRREDSDPRAWEASIVVGGTPGNQNSVHVEEKDFPETSAPPARPARDLVINELSTGGVGTGWVELYNPTSSPIAVEGRGLSVFPASTVDGTYILPPQPSVAAGGRLVINETELGFELDGIATCVLSTTASQYIDGLNPRTAETTHSTGRYPDGGVNRHVFTAPTPGGENTATLEARVVINEIMYHPADDNPDGEFIELRNRTDVAVNLGGWAFTRGVDFEFTGDVSISAGGYLVIARNPAAVEAHYGLSDVVGPYTGSLRNDRETLVLRDSLKNVADQLRYADEGSWPEVTDGFGPSVELVHQDIENRYGATWEASDGDGTPGAQNSAWEANPAPVVVGVRHAPVVPAPGDAVQIIATLSDERDIVSATLRYEIDGGGGPFSVEMLDDGVRDDGIASNDVFGALLPPQPAGSIVAFWIDAGATGGQTVTAPAGAPTPAFLYQVETPAATDVRPLYRVVMRASDLELLQTRDVRSNDLLDLTFVADGRAFYNRGIRYRGRSARRCDPLSYRIQFDHDVDFHGIKRLNLNGCNAYRQWTGLDFLRRTGVATPESWFRRVSLNGERLSDIHLRVEAVDSLFLKRVLPDDDSGNLYRGNSQANLDHRGEDFDPYRPHYLKRTNEYEDDFSDVVDLAARFSLTTDGEFPEAIEERVDVVQWAQFFAAFAILGSTENAIVLNNGDDYFLYHRFSDDRWVLFPWDLDSVFDEPEQVLFRPTTDAIVRFLQHPRYAPDYWCAVESMLSGAFETELVNARLDRLKPLFPGEIAAGLSAFVPERRAYIEAFIQESLQVDDVAGGELCLGFLVPSQPSITLTGRAPGCRTTEILVNGIAAAYNPVTTQWSAEVDVSGVELLEVVSVDREAAVAARLDVHLAAECPVPVSFLLCDANGDGENDVSDAVFVLAYLFGGLGITVQCAAALDCNSDDAVNLADPVFNLNHLFGGGASPVAPYPACDETLSPWCERGACSD